MYIIDISINRKFYIYSICIERENKEVKPVDGMFTKYKIFLIDSQNLKIDTQIKFVFPYTENELLLVDKTLSIIFKEIEDKKRNRFNILNNNFINLENQNNLVIDISLNEDKLLKSFRINKRNDLSNYFVDILSENGEVFNLDFSLSNEINKLCPSLSLTLKAIDKIIEKNIDFDNLYSILEKNKERV